MKNLVCVASFALPLAFAQIAHADTFQDRDTIGLDVSTLWEPANRDAFGAGPMFRFEGFTSRLPDWLGVVTRGGLIVDSADRIFAPLGVGVMVRPSDAGIYATLEGGATIDNETVMDEDVWKIDWTASAAVGYRLGAFDIRASALVGGMFERNVWMFSIGRDFMRVDSTISRTLM